MSRISRDSFIDKMEGGDALDVKTLGVHTKEALSDAGLNPADLESIAGADGVIDGKDELGKLFDFIDRADHNGSYRSIDTTKRDDSGHVVATESGKLLETIEHEVERARLSARPSHREAGVDSATAETTVTPYIGRARGRATSADHERALTTLDQLRFTDIHLAPSTPYFNQGDKSWREHGYPKTPPETDGHGVPLERTLRDAGCAPTALAMVDGALRGSASTPIDVADFAVAHQLSGKNGSHGSDTHGLGKAWAKANDLEYTPARSKERSKNVDVLRDGLKEGGVGVISVGVDERTGQGHFTEKGHVMVVNGYARDEHGNEWFFLVNPGRDDQAQGKVLTLDENVVQDRSLHHGAGQLRISRAQLEAEMKHGFVLSRKVDEATRP